jgi:putative tricarboxylic transport membrane protein
MHFDVILSSLVNLVTSPHLLGLMLLAVPIGTFFGTVPGLGGKLGIVMMIPFVYGMDTLSGCVFLLAMHSIVHTGGTVPSILFGIPANGPEAATIPDGFPLAQQGKAGRAIGATLTATGVGGVIGAIVIFLLLPFIQPVILAFSPAEFFMLALLGITFIASVSGEALDTGIIVGLFGLMVAFIGLDPQTGTPRFTFGQLFLWDGVNRITAILSMYAVPEMLSLGIKGEAITKVKSSIRYEAADVLQGALDVFRHWFLTVRTAVMGTFIGMIPGLGGDAASWFCYGHAVQTSKTPERFGKGAIEGVIAPNTATNSKESGGLIPTLFFGVPGSSGMAILIGVLIMLGVQPGPMLVVTGLPLFWSMIWALVIANVICSLSLLFCAQWFGRLATLRASLLVPCVFVMALLGSFLSSLQWQNMVVLLASGGLGYLFKRFGWPRAPFVIGIILGSTAEQSFHKALALWGPAFLLRPVSIVLMALIAASIGFYAYSRRRRLARGDVHHDASAATALPQELR